MMAGGAAQRYAKALFGLAQDEHRHREVRAELDRLTALFTDSREAATALLTPMHPAAERKAAVRALAARANVSPLVQNFLGFLIDQRRLIQFDEIALTVVPPIEESLLPIALRDVVLRLRKARLQEQKRAHGARVAEIEERSGAKVVVEAAQSALDGNNLEDEALREDVTRYLEDAFAGTELHEVERALRDRARSFTSRG